MSLVQAILIGCVCALTQLEGNWLGECKLREPVITGFLVGLIMGDVAKGLFIGRSLQLMWMGATNIGPTANLDIGSGGTIGAAVALMTGSDLEVAVAFALPVAVIMQMLNIMKMTAFSALMHRAYLLQSFFPAHLGLKMLAQIWARNTSDLLYIAS